MKLCGENAQSRNLPLDSNSSHLIFCRDILLRTNHLTPHKYPEKSIVSGTFSTTNKFVRKFSWIKEEDRSRVPSKLFSNTTLNTCIQVP